MNKYFLIHDLKKIIKDQKNKGKIVGFTNGCFDLLHDGHSHLLHNASIACDYLIVAINSDLSIKSIKGKGRPIEKEQTRIENLTKINDIDAVILFNDDTPIKLIKQLMPDILFKGSDYKEEEIIGSDIIKKYGGKVVLVDFLPGYSTTNIINKSSI